MADHLSLRIRKIIPQTPEAATFEFETTNGTPLSYRPGQFLTLLVTLNGRELRRSYSFSSTPGIDPYPAVTIKRVANGEVSRYLLTHWREGDQVTALPPAGRFTLDPAPETPRDVFLIGAGSGITPLFSLLKALLRDEPDSRITLIYSNQNEHTALFWREINALTQMHANLTTIHLLGDPTPATRPYLGRLNIGLLERLVTEHLHFGRERAQFYVCGPFAYMRMVRMTLIFMQFREEQIHRENFVVEALSAAKGPAPRDPSPRQVTLHVKNRTFHLVVPGDRTILQVALEHDVPLPYSCLGGVCSTCSALCTEGKVRMTLNEVLTARDLDAGWVLTCTGYPDSEAVTLRIP
jgi:ring-1,2-phenylacetyl-CoA epoxidase subunit PaaE